MGGPPAAIPFFKHAVEIDNQFAAAYAFLGRFYGDMGESVLSAENTTKAYQLRARASDAERFFIDATYLQQVTGNLEKARETFELWEQSYPREIRAPSLLSGAIYPALAEWEKAVEVGKRTVSLDPTFPFGYPILETAYVALDRLDDAEAVQREAAAQKVEVPELLAVQFQIAFLKGDQARMDRIAAEGRHKSGEDRLIDGQSFVLAYYGRVQQARIMSQRAPDAARRAQQPERAALFEAQAAVREAFLGNFAKAQRSALLALELSKGKDVQYGAAFALALSRDSSRADVIANQLEKRYPEDTAVKYSYFPELRALHELNSSGNFGKQAANAIQALDVAAPYELGWPSSVYIGSYGALYPVYVRGQAYLAANRGAEAAEFQKIVSHPGIVYNDPVGSVARLQPGRAFLMAGDKVRAKASYQDSSTSGKMPTTRIHQS